MRIQNQIVNAFRRNPRTSGRRSPLRVAGLLGLALIAVLMISACNKVALPDADDSAPRVDWRVIDAMDGGLARGGNSLTDDMTTSYVGEMAVVQMIADDSGGVMRAKLSDPVISYTCVSEDGGTPDDDETPGNEPFNMVLDYQEEVLAPDAKGEVFGELWLFDTVYFNHDCGDGLELAEGRATFYGEAENYFEGVTTGSLTLIYTP